ncbi:PiggyBac transposable element-derived protein 4 [Folsomia candida]|uniref:PiggyBac transposable element-derived protein 4 n=1 Tax=Folsomia candida TaxID=158441 RepID=A0A226EIV5_FOLCA|nr:PiggyBac transposable element-derived protein 4 [Folsomia candida]
MELFLKLFTNEIQHEVVTQTNAFADQTGDCCTRRWSSWQELNEQELLKFLAVRMLMGVNRLPEMKQYWSKDPLLQYPIISKIMKQDRYFEILKYLHFSDNTRPSGNNQILPDIKTFGYGGAIVLKLLEPYLNKFYHLYCDNYFTSPVLAKYLLEKQTYICGTLRKNRKHTDPPPARGPNKMKPGEVIIKSCQGVMTEYWRDKKVVAMISTCHDHSMESLPQRYGGGEIIKPRTVLDYNKFARGIDYSDMMKKYYNIRRKSMKWYRTLFFYLVDLCIFNSFVIYKSFHVGTKAKFLGFRLNLIRQIIGSIQPVQITATISPTDQQNRLRLSLSLKTKKNS